MKVLMNLLGMALAGFLGYSLEPNLRQQLTGKAPTPIEVAATGKIMLPLADGTQVSLEDLTKEQLPEKVVVNVPVKITNLASGITMTIEAGSQLKLVRIENANAVVSPGEGMGEGRVPVLSTNLVKYLSANPPSATKPPAKPEPVPPVAVITPPADTPPVVPVPAPTTPAGESADPPVVAEPPPVPAPAPIPEPAPVTPPATAGGTPPAGAATSEADIVKAMKDSIQSGQIKEFKIDQVLQWKGAADETADGETYQTGTILYKAETFLGTKTIEAKAFIKAGKVQRWIWPRSGMEIK